MIPQIWSMGYDIALVQCVDSSEMVGPPPEVGESPRTSRNLRSHIPSLLPSTATLSRKGDWEKGATPYLVESDSVSLTSPASIGKAISVSVSRRRRQGSDGANVVGSKWLDMK